MSSRIRILALCAATLAAPTAAHAAGFALLTGYVCSIEEHVAYDNDPNTARVEFEMSPNQSCSGNKTVFAVCTPNANSQIPCSPRRYSPTHLASTVQLLQRALEQSIRVRVGYNTDIPTATALETIGFLAH